jgi:hypothetical protein
MEVSCQFHVSAVLLLWKLPTGRVGPRAGLDELEKEKSCQESKPGRPVRSRSLYPDSRSIGLYLLILSRTARFIKTAIRGKEALTLLRSVHLTWKQHYGMLRRVL